MAPHMILTLDMLWHFSHNMALVVLRRLPGPNALQEIPVYMYLRRMVIQNVRGFRHVDFNLERSSGRCGGWTVITGDNASGKTALLKAVALAIVGPDVARILQPTVDGWIRDGVEEGTIALQIVAGRQDRFAQGRRYDKPFWSELQLGKTHAGVPTALIEGLAVMGIAAILIKLCAELAALRHSEVHASSALERSARLMLGALRHVPLPSSVTRAVGHDRS